MITFIVEHIVKEGHEKQAQKIVEHVTGTMKGKSGLVFRQVLRSQKDPRKVTTVVSWQSMADYESYRKSRGPRTPEIVAEEMKHFDVMTAEMFDVEDKVKL